MPPKLRVFIQNIIMLCSHAINNNTPKHLNEKIFSANEILVLTCLLDLYPVDYRSILVETMSIYLNSEYLHSMSLNLIVIYCCCTVVVYSTLHRLWSVYPRVPFLVHVYELMTSLCVCACICAFLCMLGHMHMRHECRHFISL